MICDLIVYIVRLPKIVNDAQPKECDCLYASNIA